MNADIKSKRRFRNVVILFSNTGCSSGVDCGTGCRCVQDDQRSFALGIQWIKVRLIGTIPAPMVFGALIDETCILWQDSCREDENGACLVYDNTYMGRYVSCPLTDRQMD